MYLPKNTPRSLPVEIRDPSPQSFTQCSIHMKMAAVTDVTMIATTATDVIGVMEKMMMATTAWMMAMSGDEMKDACFYNHRYAHIHMKTAAVMDVMAKATMATDVIDVVVMTEMTGLVTNGITMTGMTCLFLLFLLLPRHTCRRNIQPCFCNCK